MATTAAGAGIDPARGVAVARDHLRLHRDAPGLEQPVEIAVRGMPGGIELAWMHLLGLRIGIDEDQRLAAPQHELVDGIVRLVRQMLRMRDHQHVDVGRHLVEIGRQILDVVERRAGRSPHRAASAGPASRP